MVQDLNNAHCCHAWPLLIKRPDVILCCGQSNDWNGSGPWGCWRSSCCSCALKSSQMLGDGELSPASRKRFLHATEIVFENRKATCSVLMGLFLWHEPEAGPELDSCWEIKVLVVVSRWPFKGIYVQGRIFYLLYKIFVFGKLKHQQTWINLLIPNPKKLQFFSHEARKL